MKEDSTWIGALCAADSTSNGASKKEDSTYVGVQRCYNSIFIQNLRLVELCSTKSSCSIWNRFDTIYNINVYDGILISK